MKWEDTDMRASFDKLQQDARAFVRQYARAPDSDQNIREAMDHVLSALERLDGWMTGEIT